MTDLPLPSEADATGLAEAVALGVVAGLAASWVMEAFQATLTAAARKLEPGNGEEGDRLEPTTLKAADLVTRAITGRGVPKPYREVAGTIVHYGLGAILGGVYAVLRRTLPRLTRGSGTAFGGATWLALDEISVPALGLAKPWNETPAATHLYGLLSHLVFGLSAEAVYVRLARALRG